MLRQGNSTKHNIRDLLYCLDKCKNIFVHYGTVVGQITQWPAATLMGNTERSYYENDGRSYGN